MKSHLFHTTYYQMSHQRSPSLVSEWDQSEQAFDRLYVRSSRSLPPGPNAATARNGERTAHEQPMIHSSPRKYEPVSAEKLSRLTRSLQQAKGTPSGFVDYSEFAETSCDPHAVFTTASSSRRQVHAQTKQLYNEVQRTSLSFGITAEEMKTFHKRNVGLLREYSLEQSSQSPKPEVQPLPLPVESTPSAKESLVALESTSQQTLTVGATIPQPETRHGLHARLILKRPPRKKKQSWPQQHTKNAPVQKSSSSIANLEILGGATERNIGPSTTSRPVVPRSITPSRTPDKLPIDEATDATKRRGVLLEPFESAKSKSKIDLLTPQRDIIDTAGFESTETAESPRTSLCEEAQLGIESSSEMVDPFADPVPIPVADDEVVSSGSSVEGTPSPKRQSKTLRHRSTSSQSSLARDRFGSLFRKKYGSLEQGSPSRKECHSVEDTLLADAEFNDFSILRRRNSYYGKPLEFSFERPASKNASSRSSLISASPHLLQSESVTNIRTPSLTTPISSPRLKRHSVSEFGSSGESSPLTPTRRHAVHWVVDRFPRVPESIIGYSSSRDKSTSFFDPIAEHERVEHYERLL